MDYANKTILLTGASSGIGLEFAQELAKKGGNLILVARSKEKLEELATKLKNLYHVNVKVLSIDLAKSGAAEVIYNELEDNNKEVDILINNAGVGTLDYLDRLC
ncbi:SDR family NAD(P)-dependent oxidoreductase [Aureibacillus halotolerans]|uniref:Short subunit dehydrogenase n=1 Tax=Aureibacillus halotolerans TaxID=1508390 RepID=A0A4R6U2L1_9BACI|nr:SDR family NAD(P)-dependent oxidoreductase [Aureibacillus halotolerans]TDQ40668.1 short subunit dehydrogenase [Aureibacillus halotolerans]